MVQKRHFERHEDLTDELSKVVKPGDLLLFAGGAPRDRVIELFSGKYGHAALAFHEAGRVMLVQATLEDGCHVKSLAKEIDDWGGLVDHYVVESAPAKPPYDAARAITHAQTLVGRPYFVAAIVGLFLYIVSHWRVFRPHSRSTHHLFCSQLVAWAVSRGHVRLAPRIPIAATTPSDLVAGKRTRWVGSFETKIRHRGAGAIASSPTPTTAAAIDAP
jgi:hypothetical protein